MIFWRVKNGFAGLLGVLKDQNWNTRERYPGRKNEDGPKRVGTRCMAICISHQWPTEIKSTYSFTKGGLITAISATDHLSAEGTDAENLAWCHFPERPDPFKSITSHSFLHAVESDLSFLKLTPAPTPGTPCSPFARTLPQGLQTVWLMDIRFHENCLWIDRLKKQWIRCNLLDLWWRDVTAGTSSWHLLFWEASSHKELWNGL